MSDNRVYLSLFGAPCRDWLSWMEWVEQAAQRVNLPLTYVGPDRVGKEIIKARRYSHRGLLRTIQKCELEALSFYSTEEEFTQLALLHDSSLCLVRLLCIPLLSLAGAGKRGDPSIPPSSPCRRAE